jgi:hypothetical protein
MGNIIEIGSRSKELIKKSTIIVVTAVILIGYAFVIGGIVMEFAKEIHQSVTFEPKM